MKFIKKGKAAKSKEAELLLVDEKSNAYKVDPAVTAIWTMCDGKRTQEQIVDELTIRTKIEKIKLEPLVSEVLSKLEQSELIQKVE